MSEERVLDVAMLVLVCLCVMSSAAVVSCGLSGGKIVVPVVEWRKR